MIVVLHQLKVRGAIIISILVVTAIATALGLNEFKGVVGQILQLHQHSCKWTLKVYLQQVWSASFSYSLLLTCLTVQVLWLVFHTVQVFTRR